MFPLESTAIAFPTSLVLPLMVVNLETAPIEVHLIANASVPDEIGKLYGVAVEFVANVFIGTAVADWYCPVTYMFPPESTTIPFPTSVLAPLMFVNAETAPAEVHLITNMSVLLEIGKL